VLNGGDALYIGVRNSARPLGLAFTVGMRLPAYLSGSGKAMLSLLPPEEVKRLYADGLQTRLTKKGPRDVEALLKELALTRKRGYSLDDGAVREGVCGFGAPVFDAAGRAVAGIAVCVNKALVGAGKGQRYRQLALAVAHSLSERLGADPQRPPHGSGVRSRSSGLAA
jgi:DNA-binding IclR family transcriptional regulator